jgi:hypothetical protein
MFFKKNKEEPTVSFSCAVNGLREIEECRPKPASEFIPLWWDKIEKTDPSKTVGTIKSCPGVYDYLSEGYIVPMWSDTTLYFEKDTGTWRANSGEFDNIFLWGAQTRNQALDYFNMKFFNKDATFIFTAYSPWNIITKKGWSVYQMPLFYHFDNNFTALPGVIDTDIYHFSTTQIAYFGDKEEIFIPRGQPLVQYIPFERKKITYQVRDETQEDKKRINVQNINFETLIRNPINGAYRRLQHNRDKMV